MKGGGGGGGGKREKEGTLQQNAFLNRSPV